MMRYIGLQVTSEWFDKIQTLNLTGASTAFLCFFRSKMSFVYIIIYHIKPSMAILIVIFIN